MRWSRRLSIILGFVLFVTASVLLPSTTVHAEQQEGIFSQSATLIAKGKSVQDVVVVGNNALILGHVAETVVVINGNVHLGPDARVETVIDIGGSITREAGAQVGDMLSVTLSSALRNSMLIGGVFALVLWVSQLTLSVGLVVIPTLLTIVFKKWLVTPLSYVEQSARRTGLIGLLVTVAVLALAGLFTITVVGIPIAILFVMLYGMAGLLGLAVTAGWIGRLTSITGMKEREFWTQSLIGGILMMASFNVPLVGPLILIALWMTGIGAVALWIPHIFQNRRKNGHR